MKKKISAKDLEMKIKALQMHIAQMREMKQTNPDYFQREYGDEEIRISEETLHKLEMERDSR